MGDLLTTARKYLAAVDAHRVIGSVSSSLAMSDAEQALRAAVAAPVDTGWRDRAPTPAELQAHFAVHGRDGRLYIHVRRTTDVVTHRLWPVELDDDGTWRIHGLLAERLWADEGDGAALAFRFITAEGDPAPWPEVTP